MAATLRNRFPVEIDTSSKPSAPSASSSDSGVEDDGRYDDPDLKPFTPPSFTIKDLLNAIPAHCYERSAWRSSLYVVADFTMIALEMYAMSRYVEPSFGSHGKVLQGTQGVLAKWAAWCVYWTVMGFHFTGVWIIAHECGHQAFSTSKQINNAVGLVLHSLVLVPYHSWRISHSKHHAATGHMTRDEVFVPAERSWTLNKNGKKEYQKKIVHKGVELDELLEDAPLYRLYWLMVQQLFGWPAYLFMNASGQTWYPAWTNHFDPKSLIFDARHRSDVLLSDAALLVVVAGLAWVSNTWSFATMVKYYGIPYLGVNHWIVMITFLQHTDPNLPHYRKGEWNFARGALCTIDRPLLGPVGPYLMHGITETHVLHHTHSKIPHYHAWEATEALKNFLGEHYVSSNENMYVSLWKNWKLCRFVDDGDEVVFYRDAYGRAQRRVVLEGPPSDSGVDVMEKEE